MTFESPSGSGRTEDGPPPVSSAEPDRVAPPVPEPAVVRNTPRALGPLALLDAELAVDERRALGAQARARREVRPPEGAEQRGALALEVRERRAGRRRDGRGRHGRQGAVGGARRGGAGRGRGRGRHARRAHGERRGRARAVGRARGPGGRHDDGRRVERRGRGERRARAGRRAQVEALVGGPGVASDVVDGGASRRRRVGERECGLGGRGGLGRREAREVGCLGRRWTRLIFCERPREESARARESWRARI